MEEEQEGEPGHMPRGASAPVLSDTLLAGHVAASDGGGGGGDSVQLQPSSGQIGAARVGEEERRSPFVGRAGLRLMGYSPSGSLPRRSSSLNGAPSSKMGSAWSTGAPAGDPSSPLPRYSSSQNGGPSSSAAGSAWSTGAHAGGPSVVPHGQSNGVGTHSAAQGASHPLEQLGCRTSPGEEEGIG